MGFFRLSTLDGINDQPTPEQIGHRARRLKAQGAPGLASQLAATFTPAQIRVLRARARRLKAYSRQVGHYHDHGPGTALGRLQPPVVVEERRRRNTNIPIEGWTADDDDGELGFLGALLSVAAPLLGGLLGGDKAAPAPAPAAAAPAPPIIMTGGGGGGGGPPAPSLAAIGGVVSDQIRAVPPPVRQQVTDAIRESMDRYKAGQATATDLMTDIKKQLGPTMRAQLQEVNKAQLQRQATFEHESIVARDKRWKANAEAQTRILTRMNDIEQKLGGAITRNSERQARVNSAFGVPLRYR